MITSLMMTTCRGDVRCSSVSVFVFVTKLVFQPCGMFVYCHPVTPVFNNVTKVMFQPYVMFVYCCLSLKLSLSQCSIPAICKVCELSLYDLCLYYRNIHQASISTKLVVNYYQVKHVCNTVFQPRIMIVCRYQVMAVTLSPNQCYSLDVLCPPNQSPPAPFGNSYVAYRPQRQHTKKTTTTFFSIFFFNLMFLLFDFFIYFWNTLSPRC